MFKKLQNRIILITMTITSVVLLLADFSIALSMSIARPEPTPEFGAETFLGQGENIRAELSYHIQLDRKEGNDRLYASLIIVNIAIELIVFLLVRNLSGKVIEPVKDSYDKQKTFIANASHELKTPLAVIQANVEALEVDNSNQQWKNNIETEIDHASRLVSDLLNLAKMDAGTTEKNKPTKFDLNLELKNHIEIFKPKFAGQIIFKPSRQREYFLPKQNFMQIVDILLDNATKYGDKKINVILTENSLTIKNDGTTIDKNDISKIFDRFYQADKTKEGSGLGLAIAKSLCDINGWQISCEAASHSSKFIINF